MGFVLLVMGTVGAVVALIIFLDARKTLRGIRTGQIITDPHQLELLRLGKVADALQPRTVSADEISQGSLENAGGFLRVQLFSEDSRGAFEMVDREAIVSRTLCEGLWACLVWNLGHFETTVTREQFESMSSRWGCSGAELWELALDNLLLEEIKGQKLSYGEADEASEVGYLYLGNGAFVSSLAQRWERLQPDLPQDRGVLLSVPNWHALLLLPVSDQVQGALPKYLELLGGLFDSEDPLSGDVFWVREGTWTRLEQSGAGLEFPQELAALLQ